MPVDIIFLALIFGFIAYRLYITLGTTPDQEETSGIQALRNKAAMNNVVVLQEVREVDPNLSLDEKIEFYDPKFSMVDFLKGVEIFAQSLSQLKNEDELRSFKRYIGSSPYNTLKALYEKQSPITFSGFKVIDRELDKTYLDITLGVTLTQNGESTPQCWIFRRDLTSQDPNWLLQSIQRL